MSGNKKKILIVDDSELNRSLLADMLSEDFEIVEAENGVEAVRIMHEQELEISLVQLDIVMPQMDGFAVLSMMNRKGWIKTIPVIMISAETGGTYIDRAYDLGAIDYISRPFDERTVKHRVACNFMLGARQKEMSEMLSRQIYQKEKDNSLMIEILSHIVEFRNGESGLHVLHVNVITKMVLEQLVRKTDKYKLSVQDIRMISNASALHDIGKISIPSEVLNKPGRFTPEEFEIMKRHTLEGAKMLDDIPFRKGEDLIKIGYQICRWHHERFDGRGYPDGLKGDEIPIAAQVVSIADVYDALTSKRVYKDAYSPDTAVDMILRGECGTFNPLLLECLVELAPRLKKELNVVSLGNHTDDKLHDTVKQILRGDRSDASARSIRLLERERQKFRFLSDISGEIIFEYSAVPEMLYLSEHGAETLRLPMRIEEPLKNEQWCAVFPPNDFKRMLSAIHGTTPLNPVVTCKFLLTINGVQKWTKVIAKTMWGDSEAPEFEGAIGKIMDVDDEIKTMKKLEKKAELDERTGLYNHAAAKAQIEKLLAGAGDRHYALAMFDLDDFKSANDKYGHMFGDKVLAEIADRIRENIRSTDIAARMGGDEFMLFMEYQDDAVPQTERIFKQLTQKFRSFDMRVSMGLAVSDGVSDFDTLFRMADTAMYTIKRGSKNGYAFYDESMKETLQEEESQTDGKSKGE